MNPHSLCQQVERLLRVLTAPSSFLAAGLKIPFHGVQPDQNCGTSVAVGSDRRTINKVVGNGFPSSSRPRLLTGSDSVLEEAGVSAASRKLEDKQNKWSQVQRLEGGELEVVRRRRKRGADIPGVLVLGSAADSACAALSSVVVLPAVVSCLPAPAVEVLVLDFPKRRLSSPSRASALASTARATAWRASLCPSFEMDPASTGSGEASAVSAMLPMIASVALLNNILAGSIVKIWRWALGLLRIKEAAHRASYFVIWDFLQVHCTKAFIR